MRARFLYSRQTSLTPECRREIEKALSRCRPLTINLNKWKKKADTFCRCVESILQQIPYEWRWPQAPISAEARPFVKTLLKLLNDVESEEKASLLYSLEKSYHATFPMRPKLDSGHDAHLLANDNHWVQFGELAWRMKAGLSAFLQNEAVKKGRPGYDEGLLWLVRELHDAFTTLFPKVNPGKGSKSAFPAIVEAVISRQIVLENTGTETARRKRGAVKSCWNRGIIKAALERKPPQRFSAPPACSGVTTTATTAR